MSNNNKRKSELTYYERKNCILCESTNLNLVLELTPTPWADDYITKNLVGKEQSPIPLNIMLCNNCGHAQLSHIIDANHVYLNYTYETASTLGLGSHFKKTADTIMNDFIPTKGGLVVDIGSNDGILLKHFQDHGMNVLGVDPMPGIAEKASKNGIPTLSNFFNEDFALELCSKYGPAEIITSNNLVADTDDLTSFVRGVKNLMTKDSIFFFETFYLYLQIKNFVWDFTYHEHYSYFTIKPLISYFDKLGLEIIDVEPNLTKGGSMRCTIQLKDGKRKVNPSVLNHVQQEEVMGFPNSNVFTEYNKKINNSRDIFCERINELRDKGKIIAGYGASATSTTLMYHYKMGDYLEYLVDDFKVKQNLFSPGYHVPVYSSDHLYEEKPDYVIILAWRYYEKIISKHQKYLDDGGHFIIPLPELKII